MVSCLYALLAFHSRFASVTAFRPLPFVAKRILFCNTPGCTRDAHPRRAQKATPKCIANVTAFVAGAFVGRLKRTGKSASTK
jgi:hypothetical protein